MSRINWLAYTTQVRALLSRYTESDLSPAGQQRLDAAVASAVQLAKNLHRKSPIVGLVGSRLIWASSIDDLTAQMCEKGYGELYPEEEELCVRLFARTKPEGLTPMVSVWVYGPDDIEFELSSSWDYQHYGPGRSGAGGGACGVPDNSGPSSGNWGIH